MPNKIMFPDFMKRDLFAIVWPIVPNRLNGNSQWFDQDSDSI